MIKKSATVAAILLFLVSVISCEKDFRDIGTSVVDNSAFITGVDSFNINITPEQITSVRADGGITNNLGEYLLGVYNSDDLKTIEASIVSQVAFLANLSVVNSSFGADTTVVTKVDTAIIRIPYQSTNIGSYSNGAPQYRLDSILGDTSVAVPLKVYRNLSFLNTLDPTNPTQQNTYQSNAMYSRGELLNADPDFTFKVPQNYNTKDTLFVYSRNLSDGTSFLDTIRASNSAPFFTIPLDKNKIKEIFLDEYGGANFASSEAFADYFRGLIIEASGTDGAMIPFNFITGAPSLEIYYTNSVVTNGSVVDTIRRANSFNLLGIRNSIYKGSNPVTPAAGRFVIQGTAGTMANIDILNIDSDGDGISDLEEIRNLGNGNGVLINDASIVLYIDKSPGRDTLNLPNRLFMYQNDPDNPSLIRDIYTEGESTFGGQLLYDNGASDRYHFRITDHVSELVSGNSTYNPRLGLRVFNANNLPTSAIDTVFTTQNWNPRGVTLHSNTSTNEIKRAKLKISYSIPR